MKNLATILGKSEAELHEAVGKLEGLCGYPSEDVRLLGNNTTRVNVKLRQLGLDPQDTTGPELYHSLLAKYQHDADAVERALDLNAESSYAQKFARVKVLLHHSLDLHDVWVLKASAAKSLLRQAKPKKLMKALNYRSIESMLKHQDVGAVIFMAEQVESASWRKNFEAKLSKQPSTSYELRQPKIIELSAKIESSLPPGEVLFSAAAGAVSLHAERKMPALTMTLLLMDALEQIGENQTSQTLRNAHPALWWWTDAEDLIFNAEGTPVSLNFKDVATNHWQAKEFGEHICQNGHQKLWANLTSQYKKYVDELPAEAAAASQSVVKLAPTLALEPVEIYE